LLALPLKPWWPALFLVAAGLLLHVAGYLVQQARVSALAMFVGLFGLTGVTWGREWLRASFFPFFLFIFCVPFSTVITPITFALQLNVSQISEFVLHNVLGIDVLRSGTQLFDPMGKYQYEVAAACSGIRSLIAIGTMATVGAFLFFKSWWRRAVLIGLAVPLAVIGNVVRLLTIVIAAEIAGQEAGNAVHEGGPMGIWSLVPYIPAIFGFMAAGRWLSEEKPVEAKP
jgi:exosortase